MYMTEMLAILEGIERGPAGNTALAAAFHLAQELPEDGIIVISETEYTGAGKHIQAQMDFARDNGIEIFFGDPEEEDKPGTNLVLPKDPSYIRATDADLDRFRASLIKKSVEKAGISPSDADLQFLAEETKKDVEFVRTVLGI